MAERPRSPAGGGQSPYPATAGSEATSERSSLRASSRRTSVRPDSHCGSAQTDGLPCARRDAALHSVPWCASAFYLLLGLTTLQFPSSVPDRWWRPKPIPGAGWERSSLRASSRRASVRPNSRCGSAQTDGLPCARRDAALHSVPLSATAFNWLLGIIRLQFSGPGVVAMAERPRSLAGGGAPSNGGVHTPRLRRDGWERSDLRAERVFLGSGAFATLGLF